MEEKTSTRLCLFTVTETQTKTKPFLPHLLNQAISQLLRAFPQNFLQFLLLFGGDVKKRRQRF